MKKFEEYIAKGIIQKRSGIHHRANHLKKEAHKSYETLIEFTQQLEITPTNANTIIKLCYDILLELIRAELMKEGFSTTGVAAHEATIAFLQTKNWPENNILFLDQLRRFRNEIVYEGGSVDEKYAQEVLAFTKKQYERFTNNYIE